MLTDRRGREGDALTGYEQQVLNHVHKLTAGTLTGVSGAGRRDRRPAPAAPVVAPVHRVGRARRPPAAADQAPLGRPRPRPGDRHAGARRAAVVALGAQRRAGGRRRLPAVARAWPCAVAIAIVLVARRLLKRVRSRAQRPTQLGLVRAEHWLCVRAWMEPRGFEGASAGAANSSSRALAYAAALGLAERAADELPIVPEDDRLAWSNATGEWHVVRVRYPFRPGYGRHPALMLGRRPGRRRRAHRPAAVPAAHRPRRRPARASSTTSPTRPTSSRTSPSSSPRS